jgi:hypothetical protein
MKKLALFISSIIFCGLILSANVDSSEPTDYQPDVNSIKALIGLSCESDNQCQLIGLGAAPCGGHQKYLVYSNIDTDVAAVKSKVAMFNGIQRLKNKKDSKVGICRELMPPKAYCSANQCKASAVDISLKQ